MQVGIADILQERFNSVPDYIARQLETITDLEKLRIILRKAATASSCSDLNPLFVKEG